MGTIQGMSLTNDAKFVKNLYYGKPGTHKTTHLATLANLGQMVAVDLEGGWELDALSDRGINVDNIHIFHPRNFDELEQVYWEIKGMIDGGIPVIGVGLDHWSEMQDILVRDAAVERIEKKRRALAANVAKGIPEAIAEDAELNVYRTELPDYGQWTEQGKRLLRWYRDLPCHVGFASHEDTDDSGKIVPMQTEKFRNKLMGAVRTVTYCKVVEIKNEGRVESLGVTKPIDRYLGKDRTNKLPTVLAEPTMERIIKIINGTLDVSKDEAQLAYLARKGK